MNWSANYILNKHGIRVTLDFKQSKQNSIPYGDMCRFIFRETATFPQFTMIDCKSMFGSRKWASLGGAKSGTNVYVVYLRLKFRRLIIFL